MPYIPTNDIIAALRARLVTITRDAATEEKLFQRVDVFGVNRLVEAMKATLAVESRVVFIVPGGDGHENSRPDSVMVHSRRTTRLALLIADRSMDRADAGAVIGNAHAVGILALKDAVLADLAETPLELPGVALVPADGEPFVIEDPERPAGNLGREVWLQWLTTSAGEAVIAIP